jgi:hypothetical protein
MPDSGYDLGVDLYDLLRAAKHNFPTVVNEYRSALGNLNAAAAMEGALHRPEFFGYPGVQRSWPEAVEGLRRMLDETATSLELTAEALLLAVDRYAAADTGARDALNTQLQAKGMPHADPLH